MRSTLKGIIIGSSVVLLLAGCRPKPLATCPTDPTPIERFSLCLTDGWHQTTERFGEDGSFVVAIQPENGTGALMRIHVKKDPLEGPVFSSIEFAERAIAITRERAPNYKAVSTEPMMVGDKETILHIFEASEASEGDPPVRYYQFVTTNEDLAYGFTSVMTPGIDADTEEALVTILRSVEFN